MARHLPLSQGLLIATPMRFQAQFNIIAMKIGYFHGNDQQWGAYLPTFENEKALGSL